MQRGGRGLRPAPPSSAPAVTVQTPSTAISGTQDTTVVTATSDLSGHDAVYDVTTVVPTTAVAMSDVFLPLIVRGFPPP